MAVSEYQNVYILIDKPTSVFTVLLITLVH